MRIWEVKLIYLNAFYKLLMKVYLFGQFIRHLAIQTISTKTTTLGTKTTTTIGWNSNYFELIGFWRFNVFISPKSNATLLSTG